MVSQESPPAIWKRFLVAGAGGMSGWMFVHPVDVLKVRMQLDPTGSPFLLRSRELVASEGLAGLYKGLSAALMRQATYTTMRIGFYDVVKDLLSDENTLESRMAAGMISGGISAFVCCPVEICLVRMQSDGRLPLEKQRGYRNVFHALQRIGSEEGIRSYWRGSLPTVSRAMVVSMTQLSTYDQVKHSFLEYGILKDGVPLHFCSSLIAGFVYSFCSLPLDTAKTRMQDQLAKPSMISTLSLIVKTSGFRSLWTGFLPYFMRGGGHTILMFLFLEQYRKLIY